MENFLSKIQYPVGATPKIDGIRCYTSGEGVPAIGMNSIAYTRSNKQVPNDHIRSLVEQLPPWLDGELTTGTNFQAVTSGIMSFGGQPDFTYHIFDSRIDSTMTYGQRVDLLCDNTWPKFVRVLKHRLIENLSELLTYEQECLDQGAEGVMLRPFDSPYNVGTSDNRATARRPYLVAVKRFTDGEAVIIGFNEELENTNSVEQNELGNNYRPVRSDGMKPKGTLGSFRVKSVETGIEFNVGSGLTAAQRAEYWPYRTNLIGKIVKYKWQMHGTKDKPRIPIFLGFRDEADM